MLTKLLTRVKVSDLNSMNLAERESHAYAHTVFVPLQMTTDEAVQRQVMRMHGFNLMANVLRDFGDDRDVVRLALATMTAWPMQSRNKIVDSKIELAIEAAVDREDADDLKQTAAELLTSWSGLPMAYRIAKRVVRIVSPLSIQGGSTSPTDLPLRILARLLPA